jgi:hypothetical protein
MKQGSNGNYSPIGSLLKLIVMKISATNNNKVIIRACGALRARGF